MRRLARPLGGAFILQSTPLVSLIEMGSGGRVVLRARVLEMNANSTAVSFRRYAKRKRFACAVGLAIALALVAWPRSATARIGVAQSRDGQIFRGHIRLSTNGVTVLDSSTETAATISLTNLSDLYFEQTPSLEPDWLAFHYPRSNSHLKWHAQDIGSSNAGAASEIASGLFRVRSVGTNLAGSADAFHFVYRPCDGNCEIMARVVNVQPHFASKAGVMIRERLTSDSANVFFGVSEHRAYVQHRDLSGAETAIDPLPQLMAAPWLRLKRTGNEFTLSSSPDGTHWTRHQSVTVPMAEHIWIGLAACAGQGQIAGVATIDNVEQDVVVPHTSFVPQIHLQSGSVIAGPILTGDESEFSLSTFPFSVPASTVSYLLFRWLPFRYTTQVSMGNPGVLLTSGQFIQGTMANLRRDALALSSVLFGVQSFDTDSEAYALVLRRPALEKPSRYMVVTDTGSTFRARDLRLGDFEVTFNEDALGSCTIQMPDLLWLRCGQ